MATRSSLALLCLLPVLAPPLWAQDTPRQDTPRWQQTDPRYGLLTPIPDRGAVPPIVELALTPTPETLAFRARSREYAMQIRRIRHKHLGTIRVDEIRAEGIARLRELTDSAAFQPLIDELVRDAPRQRSARGAPPRN